MDSFSPSQYRQARRLWRQYTAEFHRNVQYAVSRQRDDRYRQATTTSYAEHCLRALVVTNVGAFISKEVVIARGIARAKKDWTLPLASSVGYLFSSTKGSLSDYTRTVAESREIFHFSTKWLLTNLSTRRERWYTWITSAFFHLDAQHLVSNMMSLWCFGRLAISLPGMNIFHMVAITLGSAITSSAALLYHHTGFTGDHWLATWSCCGASGIVSAVGAIAALGAPFAQLDFGIPGVFPLKVPTLAVIGFTIASDIIGLINPKYVDFLAPPREGVKKLKVGHAGHLGGAAFGVLYYLLVLRLCSKRPVRGARRESPRRLGNIDEETLRARRRNEERWLAGSSTPSSSSSERNGIVTPDSD